MKEQVMTKFDYLAAAEVRLATVKRYHPSCSEVGRIQSAIDLMYANLSTEEVAAYEVKKNTVETPDAKAKRIKADLAAMSLNRDSASI